MLEKIIVMFTGLLSQFAPAQEQYPKNYFRSPIDTSIVLAGNFAELRPNHFHMGIDIKTNNHEGMPVHAAADGYVSRVKFSSFGYGKVLYVTHPNGYVSVYGHLSSFNDSIGVYMKTRQYASKTVELELFPKPNELPVKKGEVIAYSGNTGNSGGPHIHFEIREEKTEKATNPLLWGFEVKDNKKPQVTRVKIYPADENARVNGKNEALELQVNQGKQGFTTSAKEPVLVSGPIYFGLQAFDTETYGGGKNGVYSIELWVNKKLIYHHEMDKIGFDEMRTINSFIELPEYQKTGKLIQRSYVEPNNRLQIYKFVSNRGVINFNTDSTYKVEYILKDIEGNTTTVKFPVKSVPTDASTKTSDSTGCSSFFSYDKKNSYHTSDFMIDMPENVLYNNICFIYSSSLTNTKGYYSNLHHVHAATLPVNDFFTISIKSKPVPDSLKKHLFIAKIHPGGRKEYIGGEWHDDLLTAKTKEFGDYAICADTVAPVIIPVNINPGKKIGAQKSIELKITDNLSGLAHYEAYLDGNWILMDYEYKQNKLFYIIDRSKQYNPFNKQDEKHLFKLQATDKAGNTRVYKTTLVL